MIRIRPRTLLMPIFLLAAPESFLSRCVEAFVPSPYSYSLTELSIKRLVDSTVPTDPTLLLAIKSKTPKQWKSSLLNPIENSVEPIVTEEENSQGKESSSDEVYGAKFFGGSAVKEELFDPEIEQKAEAYQLGKSSTQDITDDGKKLFSYSRFNDLDTFPDTDGRNLAKGLQAIFDSALYDTITTDSGLISYSAQFQWDTPFSRSSSSLTPPEELTHALQFYKRIDVAIISSRTLSSDSPSQKVIEVRWEISLVWPNFWASRVLLTGTSRITVEVSSSSTHLILRNQSDTLDLGGKDGRDIMQAIYSQIQPRFWDLYHIGMTPSAEMMPRIDRPKPNGIFSPPYNLIEIPPRLILQTSLVDFEGRDNRIAQALPNHAFTSIIKTMGPKSQRYVPTTPVEVSINRYGQGQESGSLVTWNIQLCPEFISYSDMLPLPRPDEGEEDFMDDKEKKTARYTYQPRRLVATIPFAGNPQDKEVAETRKLLYDRITKEGLRPRLDTSGRPIFFFLQYDAKACFTGDGGLGMAVYDWRPQFSKCNEVGIELIL